jgi:hypothetical protein
MYTHVHGGLVLIRYRPERLMSHSYIYIYILFMTIYAPSQKILQTQVSFLTNLVET